MLGETMEGIQVQDRAIITPGEVIATGMDYIPSMGTYRDKERIIANKLGMVHIEGRAIKVIPLSGRYMPKVGDMIIGQVIDISMSGWRIELNCAYSAMISLKDATSDFIERGADLTQYYNLGDYMIAEIVNVTSQKLVDLSTRGPGMRKLQGGRIITVNPNKVPRVIGKQGSMVGLIKDATGCRITVGQNGIIHIQGTPKQEMLAAETIHKVEQESHFSGLTDKIKAYLEQRVKEMQLDPTPLIIDEPPRERPMQQRRGPPRFSRGRR